MWIILIDHSSSMAHGFEASPENIRGAVRALKAKAKLDAARKAVMLQLQRLDEETEVALFGFTDTARLLHSGRAGDRARFENKLDALKADGGTDIARAIDAAVAHASKTGAAPGVQLITDGQSDIEQAKEAARRANEARMVINLFLIDPTDKGLDMAKAITRITNGQLEKVTSEEKLLEATTAAAVEQARAMEHVNELLEQAEQEYSVIAAERGQAEEIEFTAGYPARMEPDQKYPLYVFVHLASLGEEVRRQLDVLMETLGPRPTSSSAVASQPILRGKLITVQPAIQDIFVNPPRQEIIWEDDIHHLDFQIRYKVKASGMAVCSGFVNILVDGLLVSHIPVSLHVSGNAKQAAAAGSAHLFSRVFASYSREDALIVRACKEAYRVLGVHLFVDADDILTGELWRNRIRSEITKSDLFQLYWSTAAAASTNVADEIAIAKAVAGQRVYTFIRPLYWEPNKPDPPAALEALNFTVLDLSRLPVRFSTSESPAPAAPARVQVSVVFPILALDSKASARTTGAIEAAMSRVVPYLENLMDLRYYPPVTLLVDEYSVKSIRRELTVDYTEPAADGSRTAPNIDWALDILRSMSLAFHVDKLHMGEEDEWMPDDKVRSFYGLTAAEFLDYTHIKIQSEGQFVNAIVNYLAGKHPSMQFKYAPPSKTFPVDTFPAYARQFLGFLQRYAQYAEHKRGNVSFCIGYSVNPASLAELERRCPGISIKTRKEQDFLDRPTQKVTWTISLSTFNAALAEINKVVFDAIDAVPRDLQPTVRYFVATVPTYGVFAGPSAQAVTAHLHRYAKNNGWPAAISLPDTAKVLICADAVERYKTSLMNIGIADGEANGMADSFLESTLVHEHLHGILDGGIDRSAARSAADNWSEWQKGVALNESLAVWAQQHYFRDNTAMLKNIEDYMRSGEYPQWPYRGAEAVETIFQKDGVPGVRQLAAWLRRDPEAAQQAFDEVYQKLQHHSQVRSGGR